MPPGSRRSPNIGQRLYREKQSVPPYIATRDKLISAIIARLFEKFAGDPASCASCVTSLQRLTSL